VRFQTLVDRARRPDSADGRTRERRSGHRVRRRGILSLRWGAPSA
jgi:hypothetical protein